jgi:hypothetical protein
MSGRDQGEKGVGSVEVALLLHHGIFQQSQVGLNPVEPGADVGGLS